LARANAREEFRTRLERERVEQMIELPTHITTMTKTETAELKTACLDLEPVK
jgi:hypothetical protein